MSLTLIYCFDIAAVNERGNADALFSDIPQSYDISVWQEQTKQNPTIIRSRYVLVNFERLLSENLKEGAETITLNLFNIVSYTAVKDRLEIRSTHHRYTWFGHIEGVEHSQVILTVENGSMAGNITLPGEIYQVRPLGDGVHGVYEIDQRAFPDDEPSESMR
jgi:hypothetical protein